MKPFVHKRIYVEPGSLEYPLGQELVEKFKKWGSKFIPQPNSKFAWR
jgi:hypothetical protein